MGFISEGIEAEAIGFLLDSTVAGNSNSGHDYGTDLSDGEKRALMEFLKTY